MGRGFGSGEGNCTHKPQRTFGLAAFRFELQSMNVVMITLCGRHHTSLPTTLRVQQATMSENSVLCNAKTKSCLEGIDSVRLDP